MPNPRYSLYRYGLSSEGMELRRKLNAVATFHLVSLARQNLLCSVAFSERLRLTANLSSGLRRRAELSTQLTVHAEARSQFKREIRSVTRLWLTAGLSTRRDANLRAACRLGGDFTLSVNRTAELRAKGGVTLDAQLTNCVFRTATLGAGINGGAAACVNLMSGARANAFLGVRLSVCKNMTLHEALSAKLAVFAALGKEEGRRLLLTDSLRLAADAVKNYPRAVTAVAGLYVRASSATLVREVLTIRCTLPPGATLVVDTEHYTVTVNGENVLHLQEGDWPRLSRELVSLALSSGTGGALEGRAVFQEAYL